MHKLRRSSFALLLISFIPAAAWAQNSEQGATDVSIRELVQQYVAARDAMNGPAIEALFTAQADQLVSSGEWRRGRNELVQGILKSSRKESGHRTITVQTIRLLTPEVAIVDAHYDVTGPAARVRHMWTTLICQRGSAGWKIAAIRNMLPAAP